MLRACRWMSECEMYVCHTTASFTGFFSWIGAGRQKATLPQAREKALGRRLVTPIRLDLLNKQPITFLVFVGSTCNMNTVSHKGPTI